MYWLWLYEIRQVPIYGINSRTTALRNRSKFSNFIGVGKAWERILSRRKFTNQIVANYRNTHGIFDVLILFSVNINATRCRLLRFMWYIGSTLYVRVHSHQGFMYIRKCSPCNQPSPHILRCFSQGIHSNSIFRNESTLDAGRSKCTRFLQPTCVLRVCEFVFSGFILWCYIYMKLQIVIYFVWYYNKLLRSGTFIIN